MPTAVELFRQGRKEELWQMCCGYLKLDIDEFMKIQERLLLKQLELINNCRLGRRLMGGKKPETLEEFRRLAPITTYKDYCPDLLERREDILPAKPAFWVHTSGKSGDYPYKWAPMTDDYAQVLSKALIGIGMLAGCQGWQDTPNPQEKINTLYTVAPKPYISGTFADLLQMHWPVNYLPPVEETKNMPFEERIRLGFNQALSEGFDYFFGLSIVLLKVGEKLCDTSKKTSIRPYLKRPRALLRLLKGVLKSRLAGRPLMPKDLWTIKGIVGSGVDSWIYKDKIKELWGRRPLDLYSCTEGGVIASQTWDYEGMTFIPNLNFLEFIPQDELLKWQMDRSYKMKTLLLNEVRAGEEYEIIITNFHGGAMLRYRVGDIIRITSLSNDALGIKTPQMVFERRADDMINFMVIKLTEKHIWKAIEKANIQYEDWTAYKIPGESELNILIELKNGAEYIEKELAGILRKYIIAEAEITSEASGVSEQWRNSLDFSVQVKVLPNGTFAGYTAKKQSEGADPAHLKIPHVNAPDNLISSLLSDEEENIMVVKRRGVKKDDKQPGKIEIS